MKLQTPIACLCLLAFCNAAPEALAQGRIGFFNDSLHLVYFSSDSSVLRPGDAAFAGQVVPAGGLTYSGITLAADLWAGTSSTSLVELTSTGFGSAPGQMDGVNLTTAFAAGTTVYLQVEVYDAAAGSFWGAAAQGTYYGMSPIFTTVANGGALYSSIVNPNAPAFSTWAPGSWNLDSSTYGVGARGAIAIRGLVPEPGSAALLCLGAAGLVLARRRQIGAQRLGPATRRRYPARVPPPRRGVPLRRRVGDWRRADCGAGDSA